MDYTNILNNINDGVKSLIAINSLQAQLTALLLGIVIGGFTAIALLKGVFKNV